MNIILNLLRKEYIGKSIGGNTIKGVERDFHPAYGQCIILIDKDGFILARLDSKTVELPIDIDELYHIAMEMKETD